MLARELESAFRAATIVDEVAFDRPAAHLLVVNQPTLGFILLALRVDGTLILSAWIVVTRYIHRLGLRVLRASDDPVLVLLCVTILNITASLVLNVKPRLRDYSVVLRC